MHDTALALALVRLGAWEEFLVLPLRTRTRGYGGLRATIFFPSTLRRLYFGIAKPRHRMVTSERLLYLTPVCD